MQLPGDEARERPFPAGKWGLVRPTLAAGSHAPPELIKALTGIRGFAAIWVVLYHLRELLFQHLGAGPFTSFVCRGYLGVDLFAFVSGFIIAHTYGEKLDNLDLKGALRFLWLRFARTYPLHLFVLALFVAVLVFDVGVEVLPALYMDPILMRQLFLLNGLGFETEWGWNIPTWSLGAEWFCYLSFPLVIPYINRLERGWIALAWAIAVLTMTAVGMYYLGYPNFDPILDWGFFRIAGEFFTGCLLYRAYLNRALFNGFVGVAGLLILVALVAGMSKNPADLRSNYPGFPVVWLIFGFAAFVYCLAQGRPPLDYLFNNRVSIYLGEISYSIYMLHWFVVANEETFGFDRFDVAVRPWLMLGAVLVGSAVTYELVERPSRRYLRSWFKSDHDRTHANR